MEMVNYDLFMKLIYDEPRILWSLLIELTY